RLPGEKQFSDQLRIVLAEPVDRNDPQSVRKMRRIAEKLAECAMNGEGWAICQVADGIDGKRGQESTGAFGQKSNATDWPRAELVAFLNDACAGGERVAETDGS